MPKFLQRCSACPGRQSARHQHHTSYSTWAFCKRRNSSDRWGKQGWKISKVLDRLPLWISWTLGWSHGSDRNFTIVIVIVGIITHLFRGRIQPTDILGLGHLVTKYQQDIPVVFQSYRTWRVGVFGSPIKHLMRLTLSIQTHHRSWRWVSGGFWKTKVKIKQLQKGVYLNPNYLGLPSLKLTHAQFAPEFLSQNLPLKEISSTIHFQGQTVSFREGIDYKSLYVHPRKRTAGT